MRLEVRSRGYSNEVTDTSTPGANAEAAPADAGGSKYSLALQLRLVGLGLAEVVVVDGVPGVAVDPIFEAARAAALAGLDDRHGAKPEARFPGLVGID